MANIDIKKLYEEEAEEEERISKILKGEEPGYGYGQEPKEEEEAEEEKSEFVKNVPIEVIEKFIKMVPSSLWKTIGYLFKEIKNQDSETITLQDVPQHLKEEIEELAKISFMVKADNYNDLSYEDKILQMVDTDQGLVVKFSDYINQI